MTDRKQQQIVGYDGKEIPRNVSLERVRDEFRRFNGDRTGISPAKASRQGMRHEASVEKIRTELRKFKAKEAGKPPVKRAA